MELCRRPVMIDALRVCYTIENAYHIDMIKSLKVGEQYDFMDFHLYRVEGKRFENVYEIAYYEPAEGIKVFGHLKFNMKKSIQSDDISKVWIWVENWVFYDYMALHYLSYITTEIGLRFHNITALDLCLDVPFDLPRKLRRLLKRKDTTTILNGKKVKDRDTDRPEITYTYSGSLNRDKYLTVNIKQKNAIKSKSNGVSLIAYNKLAEIHNSSNKDYISYAYDFPDKLYRLEIHLNNAQIKEYWTKYGREVDESLIYNQGLLTIMFIEVLNSLVRFRSPEGPVDFETMLAKYITTTPYSDYLKQVKYSK